MPTSPFSRSLLALAIAVMACDRPELKRSAQPMRADIELDQATFLHFEGSALRIVAKTPHVGLARSSGEFSANSVNVQLPETQTTIVANTVSGAPKEKIISGANGITFEDLKNHFSGNTERLVFDRSSTPRGLLSGDGGLFIEGDAGTLSATSFTVDVNTRAAQFAEPRTTFGAQLP